jgi:hypothetical protein
MVYTNKETINITIFWDLSLWWLDLLMAPSYGLLYFTNIDQRGHIDLAYMYRDFSLENQHWKQWKTLSVTPCHTRGIPNARSRLLWCDRLLIPFIRLARYPWKEWIWRILAASKYIDSSRIRMHSQASSTIYLIDSHVGRLDMVSYQHATAATQDMVSSQRVLSEKITA